MINIVLKKNTLLLLILVCPIIVSSKGITKNYLNDNNTATIVGKKKIKLTCSQNDAEIFVDDNFMGKGNLEIKVPDEACTTVVVKKVGYITVKIEFCNKKNMTKLPSSYHFSLKKDEAYEVTIHSDIVNNDYKIKSEEGKDTSWKLLNQIILDNFDAIEMADKETGYIRTSWVVKRFENSAIRTRFIVKEFSDNPLVYKIKLLSEHSQNPMAGANQGEYFKEWNRVLKRYAHLESEIQARVK